MVGQVRPNAADQVRFIGATEGVTVRSLMQSNHSKSVDQWRSFEAYQALQKIAGVAHRTSALR